MQWRDASWGRGDPPSCSERAGGRADRGDRRGRGWGALPQERRFAGSGDEPCVGAMLDIGYRFDPHVALGAHLAMSRFHYDGFGSVAVPNHGVAFVPITLGLSAQITCGRVWLVPTIGVEDSQLDNDEHKSY